ncbi:orotate phosphoribosyltransferase [Tumebacillus sp. ITR2]|uniref:Orotate phosphoribosyltransferase n=1 Tax=Tumebacillus amylolyticus TaxID=2801339 RepID=A0ABS1JGR6_9BACL|nr:orotate phosphoribosyltransferase [Tumebacillus amylolyticus]
MGDKIAKALLDIQAVALKPHDPFIWSSGLRSPIYCDNRLTISYPEIRDMIADGFVELIKEQFGDVDVIAGAATGGVPHAAWVAQKLGKPMIYVRSSAKKHGTGNMVEGVLREGQTVVIIEDLISTGGSSLNVVEGVRQAGGTVAGVAAIFSYEFQKAVENFQAADCKFATLSSYSKLLPIAVQENYVTADDLELLRKWKDAPDQF